MIRPAKTEDLPRILQVYASARSFMCSAGNPTQWVDGYPQEDLLAHDIALQRLYVVEKDSCICAVFMMCAGPDPTYAVIDGNWSKDAPYGVLHRVASDGTQKGIVSACVAFAAQRYDYLRIDTHADNKPMQAALAREGFVYRGIITVYDGTPRMAYDK